MGRGGNNMTKTTDRTVLMVVMFVLLLGLFLSLPGYFSSVFFIFPLILALLLIAGIKANR